MPNARGRRRRQDGPDHGEARARMGRTAIDEAPEPPRYRHGPSRVKRLLAHADRRARFPNAPALAEPPAVTGYRHGGAPDVLATGPLPPWALLRQAIAVPSGSRVSAAPAAWQAAFLAGVRGEVEDAPPRGLAPVLLVERLQEAMCPRSRPRRALVSIVAGGLAEVHSCSRLPVARPRIFLHRGGCLKPRRRGSWARRPPLQGNDHAAGRDVREAARPAGLG
jgi:hypothetical protein